MKDDEVRLRNIVEVLRQLEAKAGSPNSRIAQVSYAYSTEADPASGRPQRLILHKIGISEAVLLDALQNEEKTLRKSIATRLRTEADLIENGGA